MTTTTRTRSGTQTRVHNRRPQLQVGPRSSFPESRGHQYDTMTTPTTTRNYTHDRQPCQGAGSLLLPSHTHTHMLQPRRGAGSMSITTLFALHVASTEVHLALLSSTLGVTPSRDCDLGTSLRSWSQMLPWIPCVAPDLDLPCQL